MPQHNGITGTDLHVPLGYSPDPLDLFDNTSDAMVWRVDASNEFLRIDTTNGAEAVTFGNTTGNPVFEVRGNGGLQLPDGSQIEINDRTGDPTNESGWGKLYTKTISGVVELFFIDDAGSVTQITNGGAAIGNAFVNNGNSFGAAATVGTNDAYDLNLEAGGVTMITLADATDVVEITKGIAHTGIVTENTTTTRDVTENTSTYFCDPATAGGDVTLALPDGAGVTAGQRWLVKIIATSANDVIIDRSNGGSIEGVASNYTLSGAALNSVTILADGTNFWLV